LLNCAHEADLLLRSPGEQWCHTWSTHDLSATSKVLVILSPVDELKLSGAEKCYVIIALVAEHTVSPPMAVLTLCV
jgi:hypothetical protein